MPAAGAAGFQQTVAILITTLPGVSKERYRVSAAIDKSVDD